MSSADPLIRDISDTARWAAIYRAWETERPDALFRDPFARRLAGERGEQIAEAMPQGKTLIWPWIARTCLFDQFITEQVHDGVDLVVNLAAGLDARPYRMALPPTLRWVEIDLPGMISYKEQCLKNEKPACIVERVPLDLADVSARRRVFDEIGRQGSHGLVVTEGLLIYLGAANVGLLAQNLAQVPSFHRWLLELASPGLLAMLQKNWSKRLDEAGARLQFAPEQGPAFFEAHGWRPLQIRGFLREAARLKRVSLWMRLLALLPESNGRQGKRPWAAACLFEKT